MDLPGKILATEDFKVDKTNTYFGLVMMIQTIFYTY